MTRSRGIARNLLRGQKRESGDGSPPAGSMGTGQSPGGGLEAKL